MANSTSTLRKLALALEKKAQATDARNMLIKMGSDTEPNMWDNIVQWAQDHPELASGIGGGLLGGGGGGLAGYFMTKDQEKKKRNALLGALAGATLGGGGSALAANLLKGDPLEEPGAMDLTHPELEPVASYDPSNHAAVKYASALYMLKKAADEKKKIQGETTFGDRVGDFLFNNNELVAGLGGGLLGGGGGALAGYFATKDQEKKKRNALLGALAGAALGGGGGWAAEHYGTFLKDYLRDITDDKGKVISERVDVKDGKTSPYFTRRERNALDAIKNLKTPEMRNRGMEMFNKYQPARDMDNMEAWLNTNKDVLSQTTQDELNKESSYRALKAQAKELRKQADFMDSVKDWIAEHPSYTVGIGGGLLGAGGGGLAGYLMTKDQEKKTRNALLGALAGAALGGGGGFAAEHYGNFLDDKMNPDAANKRAILKAIDKILPIDMPDNVIPDND